MRYPAAEKLEIIRLVEQSHLPVRRTLGHLGIPPATFYRWHGLYQAGGPEASVYRLLAAHDLITSPAFTVVKAADEFHTKTTAPNQLWQTDFTYLKVVGWGWFYLSTVLDDFSRYIIAWKLCATMAAEDVTETLELALTASGCSEVRVRHRPR